VLSLFRTQKGLLKDEDVAIGRALADVATISLLHERTAKEIAAVNAQLRQALTSRVLIEQAKGVIATRKSITMDEAFKRLRDYSRAQQKPMHLSAADVIDNHIVI
jgi:AmiR/NasT family two-component response regulator